MGLGTLKITDLESKRYAVRERDAPLFGEETTLRSAQGGWPGLRNFEPFFKEIN